MLGAAVAPATAHVPPERLALQMRVQAVRAALDQVLDQTLTQAAGVAGAVPQTPAATWLLAQATNWTNWPKWSKWSNWANR